MKELAVRSFQVWRTRVQIQLPTIFIPKTFSLDDVWPQYFPSNNQNKLHVEVKIKILFPGSIKLS